MKTATGLKSILRKKLPNLILALCLVQPVLDAAGFWQNRLGVSNTVTMLLRMLLLGGTVLLGFFLSDRKRYYFIAAGILLALTAGHIAASLKSLNGYEEPVLDLINLVRIYFLPLSVLCFITFLRQNEDVFPAMQKGMVLDVLIIFGIQIVSVITGTNPYTYAADKVGILGWFMWTNSQSAILAMLCPISICWVARRWNGRLVPVILITAISEVALYLLAPRLSYASLIGSGFGLSVCLLIVDRRRWKQAAAILLITLVFVAVYPFSPTYSRLHANERRAEVAREEVERLDIKIPTRPAVTTAESTEPADTAENPTETEVPATEAPEIILDNNTAQELEKFYRAHDLIWSMVSRFGRTRVFNIYGYTLDPTVLGNTRLMKINFCKMAMRDSGPLSRLFGLDLKDMTAQRYDAKGRLVTDNYDVENDFHGIYFLTGIVGFAMMCVFLLWFGLRALIAVIKKPKIYFNLQMVSFAIAYGLGLLHAYFTASVLRRNNASIYMAMVLAGIWFLSHRSQVREKEEG